MPTANLNGTELHYRDAGTGTSAVLLLHAFPLHSGMWAAPDRRAREAAPRASRPTTAGSARAARRPRPSTLELLAEDVRALLAHLRHRAGGRGRALDGRLPRVRALPAGARASSAASRSATRRRPPTPTRARPAARSSRRPRSRRGSRWVADEMVPKLLKADPDPAVVKEVRALIQPTARRPASPRRSAGWRGGPTRRRRSRQITCPTLVDRGRGGHAHAAGRVAEDGDGGEGREAREDPAAPATSRTSRTPRRSTAR